MDINPQPPTSIKRVLLASKVRTHQTRPPPIRSQHRDHCLYALKTRTPVYNHAHSIASGHTNTSTASSSLSPPPSPPPPPPPTPAFKICLFFLYRRARTTRSWCSRPRTYWRRCSTSSPTSASRSRSASTTPSSRPTGPSQRTRRTRRTRPCAGSLPRGRVPGRVKQLCPIAAAEACRALLQHRGMKQVERGATGCLHRTRGTNRGCGLVAQRHRAKQLATSQTQTQSRLSLSGFQTSNLNRR